MSLAHQPSERSSVNVSLSFKESPPVSKAIIDSIWKLLDAADGSFSCPQTGRRQESCGKLGCGSILFTRVSCFSETLLTEEPAWSVGGTLLPTTPRALP